MPPDPSNRRPIRPQTTPAFTLVELLVVIAVIGILAGALLLASTMMIDVTKTRNTRAVLIIVRDAVEQFREEQRGNPTLTRPPAYQARYGFYPPDELEVFTDVGIPPPGTLPGSRAVGGAVVIPSPGKNDPYGTMKFHVDGLTWEEQAREHRDLAAMILAIRMFSEAADTMLDRIPSSHRTPGPLRADGSPAQFLDRPPPDKGTPPAFVPMEDEQIRYIVDSWGIPITYFAQRDFDPEDPPDATVSANHADWNEASTEMIRLNRRQPVLFSYGPDGPEQLTKTIVEPEGSTTTLVQDWADDDRINDPLNEDTVYPDPSLNERLTEGAPEP